MRYHYYCDCKAATYAINKTKDPGDGSQLGFPSSTKVDSNENCIHCGYAAQGYKEERFFSSIDANKPGHSFRYRSWFNKASLAGYPRPEDFAERAANKWPSKKLLRALSLFVTTGHLIGTRAKKRSGYASTGENTKGLPVSSEEINQLESSFVNVLDLGRIGA